MARNKVDIDLEIGGIDDLESANEKIIELEEHISDLKGEMNSMANESSKEFKKLQKDLEESNKKINSLGGTTKKTGSAFGAMSKTLMSGLGIGIVIQLVDKVTEILMQNQVVVDAVNTAFTGLTIAVTNISDAITDAFNTVSEANGGFDATKKVIGSLLNIALIPLKLVFNELKLAVLGIQLAWEQSIFGDGDQERITELKDNISETADTIVGLGDELLENGKVIVDNIGEAANEVIEGTKAVTNAAIESVEEMSVESLTNQSKALVQAEKAYEKLEIKQQGLIEQYDREAEVQRQIRDNVNLSIEDRITANEKLSEILLKQAEAERATVTERIDILQMQENLLGTNEDRQNEILRLKAEEAAINARITGQKSEQLTNENALLQEKEDILNSTKETQREIAEIEDEVYLSGIEDKIFAFEEEKRLLQERTDLRLQSLQEEIALAEEGTAKFAKLQNQKALLVANTEAKITEINRKQEEQRSKNEEKQAENRAKIKEAEENMKIGIVTQGLNALTMLAQEGTALSKATAIAGITVDAAQAAIGIWKNSTDVAFGPLAIAYRVAQTAALAASTVKAIQSVNQTQLNTSGGVSTPQISAGGASGAGTGGGANSAPQVPEFQLNGVNNDPDNIGGDTQDSGARQNVIRAYVVESDITDSQNKINKIKRRSEIG